MQYFVEKKKNRTSHLSYDAANLLQYKELKVIT